MPVLYWLDVGIGYAFAMLLMATLTGAFVGLVQSGLKSRTKWLADGLMSIIANLDPQKTNVGTAKQDPFAPKAEALTEEVKRLAWTIVSDVSVKGGTQLAEVIGREELVLLLLRNASIGDAGDQGKLWKLCVELTGRTPGELLAGIQAKLVEMERDDPQAPAYLWRVRAIDAAGAGAFAGRIFAWYDNTMRRVEDRVNYAARKWSVGFSLVLCAWMNVNSFDLLTKLQRDGVFRAAMADMGTKAAAQPPPETPAEKPTGTPTEQGAAPPAEKKEAPQKPFEQLSAEFATQTQETTSILGLSGALHWNADVPGLAKDMAIRLITPGIWLSAMMVSLGTAFWFGLLNKLVGLKSMMQEASEKVRATREADQRATK